MKNICVCQTHLTESVEIHDIIFQGIRFACFAAAVIPPATSVHHGTVSNEAILKG